MSASLAGARRARPSFFRRLVARAQARELSVFVVPGPEAVRAIGADLEATGLRISATPRHAGVLVLVGELPSGLKKAAAVAYAQMPRPRAILAVEAGNVSPLPDPDVAVGLGQEDVAAGVAELRWLFAQGAFSLEAEAFDVDAIRTQTEYVCPMHPEVVRSEPGSCPICGMDLVLREAAGSQIHGAHHDAHGDMDHSGHDHADHQSGDGGDTQADPDGHGSSGHDKHEGRDEHAGMQHGEHEGHGQMAHGGHGQMDHGDMGFMSMVEMTRNLPRSSDGLQMEWVGDVPFGPLFPGLPGGLTLTLTLDGDTVARAEAKGVERRASAENLSGPAETLADRLARLDPLSPVAYRVLALRAFESATGVEPDEHTALARVGALEKERAASHLGWLSLFGCLIGYRWLEDRAGSLQLALARAANVEEVVRLRTEAGRLSRRVAKTPLLRRKLGRVGILPEGRGPLGPVARAAGMARDARSDEEVYRYLGFEPVVRDGDDALSRLQVRLDEIEQSLELVRKAGEMEIPKPATNGEPSVEGSALVETPRGAATLRLVSHDRASGVVELGEPSARHLGLVGEVAEGRELADALVGVASLDLSPWGSSR